MSGVRKKNTIKIKEIPNVVLMPSSIQSTELLSISIGVITLSGTATHEAAILGKPSICIARPPFRKNIQYADFSTEFKISDLHLIFLKWKEMKIYKLDLSNWNEWINSQIDAF